MHVRRDSKKPLVAGKLDSMIDVEAEVGEMLLKLIVRTAAELAPNYGTEKSAIYARNMVADILGVDTITFCPTIRFTDEEDDPKRLTGVRVDLT